MVGEIRVERGDPTNLSKIVSALRNLIESTPCLETTSLSEIVSGDLPRPTLETVMPYYGWSHIKKLSLHEYL